MAMKSHSPVTVYTSATPSMSARWGPRVVKPSRDDFTRMKAVSTRRFYALVSCQVVALDRLQARGRTLALYERYGALLTDHQQAILDLYLRSDWSLAEIAEHEGTSRAAVHDIVKRSTRALQEYERRLGLLTEAVRRKRAIEALEKELEGLQRRMARLSV